jgi:hypothetical protein
MTFALGKDSDSLTVGQKLRGAGQGFNVASHLRRVVRRAKGGNHPKREQNAAKNRDLEERGLGQKVNRAGRSDANNHRVEEGVGVVGDEQNSAACRNPFRAVDLNCGVIEPSQRSREAPAERSQPRRSPTRSFRNLRHGSKESRVQTVSEA